MSGRHLHAVESPRRTPAEIAAERLRALEEFVARYGLDYWDHHDTVTYAQLDLESEAA
jgi:hypothetical protein